MSTVTGSVSPGGAAGDGPPLTPDQPAPEHVSAMRRRFGFFAERFGRALFSHVVINEAVVAKIRELSEKGTLVYVLRDRSFLDYFLLNYVLRREELPLPVFANGVSSTPVGRTVVILRRILARLRARLAGGGASGPIDHEYCATAVAAGRPVLVFMRGRRLGRLGGRLQQGATAPVGSDYLREILHGSNEGEAQRYIVPMALFRGRSFRKRESAGISALVYSVAESPSDRRKLLAYWWNRRDLFITVGTEVALSDFIQRYPEDSEERLVRRLTRAIHIFLHREERIVLGPALMPRRKIKSIVLENEDTRATIRKVAAERGVPEAKVRKEAESYFEEMAAEFNGLIFAVVAYFFKKIWNRMFQGLEPIGFEKVIEKAKHHPIVLVPCHRSHFDYLILTYLFYLNFVSPPHIAAGINMSFPPMGPFFRASGAYFIRRSFHDNEVYKAVFGQYLTFLMREGYTQEFFIEGGRSRTGKILTPKLGMLSALVSAYISGIRRDVYLVPVSIHYGRIVEEEAYGAELTGEDKEPESFGALVRARRFLQQKYGTIYVSFAEPISLSDELGERKQHFHESEGDEEIEKEKRRFVRKLGFRILKDVNEASVAGASAISSTVLLGAWHRGFRYEDFRERANALAELTRIAGLRPTASLQRNRGDFRESVDFLTGNGLIEELERGSEKVLIVRENKRLALDFYKNTLIHAFLLPSLVTFCLAEEGEEDTEGLIDRIMWWLDMFRYEFPLPTREEVSSLVDRYLGYYREVGALGEGGLDTAHAVVLATINVLENFRESYYLVARTLADTMEEAGMSEKAMLGEIRKSYKTSLLLGEVVKPEGATDVTLRNALNRYAELGFVEPSMRGRGGGQKWLSPGPKAAALPEFVDILHDSLRQYSPVQVSRAAPRPLPPLRKQEVTDSE